MEEIRLLVDTPIIETGRPGSFNGSFNEPGALIYHENQFHMFLTGYGGFPRPNGIAYLISEDGIEWTNPLGEELIITHEDVLGAQAVNASSVVIEEDGMWVLYFGSYDSSTWFPSGQIWRATASDPQGDWTISETPVLTLDDTGGLDERTLFQADVIKTGDEYMMYYAVAHSINMSIGLATSEDGINWTKHHEPILEAEQDWESRYVNRPRVIRINDETWLMLYGSNIPGPGIGIAISEDGINWERVSDDAIFPATLIPDMVVFNEFALVFVEETVYIAVEASTNNTVGPSEIYMLQIERDELLSYVQS